MTSNAIRDFYFVYNLLSDLVNYFVFVIVCVIVDICMVIQLRRVLNEKSMKSAMMSANQKQIEMKKAESEAAVNKAVKMVVLNSAIGILFKVPVCFIPLLNVYAEYFYKYSYSRFFHSYFAYIYPILIKTEFHSAIQSMSNLFYTLSLAIQMFIYIRFDKKFRVGYERLKKIVFT